MTNLIEYGEINSWQGESIPTSVQQRAIEDLEAGNVLLLTQLGFTLDEKQRNLLLDGDFSDLKAKNVSFNPVTG